MTYLDTIKDKKTAQQDKDQLTRSMQELVRLLTVSNSQAPKDFSAKVDKLSNSILKSLESFKDSTTVNAIGEEYKNVAILLSKYSQKNTDTISDALMKVSESLTKLQSEQPSIVVQTEPIDLSSLETTLSNALQGYSDSKPIQLADFKPQDITDDGETQYIGFMHPSGVWYIIENQTKNGKLRYLFGKNKYATHMKSAGSYKYQTIDKAMKGM